jgi:Protein of unknown function (DUF3108)
MARTGLDSGGCRSAPAAMPSVRRQGKGCCLVNRGGHWRFLILAAALPVAVIGEASPTRAQGKLEAQYVASLAGVPVGSGSWSVEVTDEQFSAAASGGTSGLVRVFTSGQGTSSSQGRMNAGQPVPSTFASSIVTGQKFDEVRMVLSGGAVKESITDPPIMPSPERIPLTDAHKRGITDPMTASLIRVPGNGDTFVPEACQRTLAIFDGRIRYDLDLSFKRLDRVKSERGYQGTVVVCAVQFSPIAGHVPERSAIKYLVALREIELWLAPLAGTRLMVPYRISIPTPLGLAVLQATQFVSVPQASRAAVTVTKTQ